MDKKTINLVAVSGLLLFVLGLLIGSRYYSEEMSVGRDRASQLQVQTLLLDEQAAELIHLRASTKIDRQSLESLRKSVADLDEQLSTQTEELKLYGKLLKIGNVDEGLQILNIRIIPGQLPNSFVYSFVIRQQAVSLKTIKVGYSVEVSGQRNGEAVSYSPAELTDSEEAVADKTELKYFSVVEELVNLPKDFVPQYLLISAWPVKARNKRSEVSFDWPEIEQ